MPELKSTREVVTSNDFDQIADIDYEIVPLAQAFTENYAQLAFTVQGRNGRSVYIATSKREVHGVNSSDNISIGSLLLRDSPKSYSRIVAPRWSTTSCEAFRQGELQAEPIHSFENLKKDLDTLIDFSHEPIYSYVVGCWIVGTYFYRMFDAFPYLGVLGPMGSGKTKLASIIEEVAFNPLRTDSITPAQLFRSVHISAGTLILDEQEALSGRSFSEDRLSILRGGYKKGGNVVRTNEGRDGYTTEEFDTYCPKVIITTTEFDQLLANRCIPIHMLRTTNDQGKTPLSEWVKFLREDRDELYCLALEVFPQVRKAYRKADLAPGLNNRQRERWLPILAIANTFCPIQVSALLSKAMQDTDQNLLADPIDTAFLKALNVLVDRPTKQLDTASLRSNITSQLGEPITSAKVGRVVSKFLGNIKRRSGEGGSTRYTITREQVNDLLQRYPITEGSEGIES